MIRTLLALVLALFVAGCLARPAAYQNFPRLSLPLPKASDQVVIPASRVGNPANFGQIAARIGNRLQNKGYGAPRFYATDGGFVMVSATERIADSGLSFVEPDRFKLERTGLCRLSQLFDCLTNADPGRYRTIAFVVSNDPRVSGGSAPSFEDAQALSEGGGSWLPEGIAERPFTSAHRIVALIYEFERPSVSADPRATKTLSAATHLRRAGLF